MTLPGLTSILSASSYSSRSESSTCCFSRLAHFDMVGEHQVPLVDEIGPFAAFDIDRLLLCADVHGADFFHLDLMFPFAGVRPLGIDLPLLHAVLVMVMATDSMRKFCRGVSSCSCANFGL